MMRLIAKTLAVTALLAASMPLWADQESSPVSWIATSQHGNVMFKMVAPKWDGKAMTL
ncbi:MAG: hypothetical protein ACO1TE_11010 [Prosthecobacter sp.]